MNEQEILEHFNQDVEHMLHPQETAAPAADLAHEYSQILEIAHNLAALDASPESQVRQRLRGRLLSRIGTQQTILPAPVRPINRQQRWNLLYGTLAVLFIMGMFTFMPMGSWNEGVLHVFGTVTVTASPASKTPTAGPTLTLTGVLPVQFQASEVPEQSPTATVHLTSLTHEIPGDKRNN